MLDFILFMLFIALLVFFPYKKAYVWLVKYLDVRLLLGAIVLMFMGSIHALFSTEDVDTPAVPPAGRVDFPTRINFTMSSFADALGWMCLIVGIILLLTVIWQALQKKKESAAKK